MNSERNAIKLMTIIPSDHLDVALFLTNLKKTSDIRRAGMVLVHNGIVRATSRDGTPVSAVDITVDRNRLREILAETEKMPGVVAANAEIREGRLEVGQDVMLLGVAGDIRENVLHALSTALDRIKKEVTEKREITRQQAKQAHGAEP